MRNIRLNLGYDGTEYHGFQRQPEFHGPTIQGTLEKVWRELTSEEINITTAGRTDTGVHAAGQVVNFLSNTRIPLDKIPKAFNSLLPPDIRVHLAIQESEDFNARISAKWKRYEYRIYNGRIQDVFTRLYTLHEPVELNVDLMKLASKHLEGKHNFKAFSASGASSKTFVRTLYKCEVQKKDNLITVTCIGDGFLYNMVRIIAGTLIYVGKGRIRPEDMTAIIQTQDRKKAGKTALAQGLTLCYVHYGQEHPSEIYPELWCTDPDLNRNKRG